MEGVHLTADLHGCAASAPMSDAARLRGLCLAAVARAGLTPVGDLFHRFEAPRGQQGGITAVVLLAESHLAAHTWPELGAATLDVYVCNFGADNTSRAESLLAELIAAFAPAQVGRQRLRRGRFGEPP